MTILRTGVLGILIALGVGAIVRTNEPGARPGATFRQPLPLSAWFHRVGLLATIGVLTPPPGQDLLVDFCARIGSLLLIEGIVVIGGVTLVAGRLHQPALGDDHAAPTWEERP